MIKVRHPEQQPQQQQQQHNNNKVFLKIAYALHARDQKLSRSQLASVSVEAVLFAEAVFLFL